MNDVERIRRELTSELKRRGTKITAVLKRQINAAAADAAMLERCRDAMNRGEAIDTEQYFQLRRAEEESRIALLGESAVERVDKIEIELIPAPAQFVKLKDENSALRLRVAELESALAQVPPGALDVAPGVGQPLSSDGQAAGTPAPNNVIPLVESREQRIARQRFEAGDRPQALRSAFSLDGILHHEGRGRFDFPTNRGGW